MKRQHTRGPWEARELIPDGHIIRKPNTYEIWTPNYSVVADVSFGGPIRKKADAYLIAAAPMLYDGLRPFARIAEHLPDEWCDDRPVWKFDGVVVTVGHVREAARFVAQAEGDQ